MKNTWSIQSQVWYAEQICLKRKLSSFIDGDDPHQLGGNIIVNKEGKLSMIYRSQTPLDRPSVKDMLNMVRNA